ncbi:MAG TPA: hypothetical protein PLA18_07565 [Deltaproteobacteria bacterium]|nr:hypothetical protein [Deltaproteobacteria bacterium]
MNLCRNGFVLVILMAVSMFVSGCSHHGHDNDGTPAAPAPGAYITGFYLNDSDVFIPVYWKDGVLNYLDPLVPGKRSRATAVDIEGSDIYIAGSCNDDNDVSVAGYWKNNVWTSLPSLVATEDARAKGILVKGSDVYVVGGSESEVMEVPGYWLNGVWNALPTLADNGGSAVSITTDGTDIYISGYTINSSDQEVMCYWKNGTRTDSTTVDSSPSINGGMTIALSSDGVLIPGFEYSNPSSIYWPGYMDENGTWIDIENLDDDQHSEARAIYVSDSDVYMAGYSYNSDHDGRAVYWKNTEIKDLEDEGSPQYIYVIDNTVYAVGFNDSENEFGHWKDDSGVISWTAYEMPPDFNYFGVITGGKYVP